MHNFEILGFGLLHIAIAISLRVIMKRRAPGVSLAWLLLVIVLPYAGAVLYILLGERTLGRRRVKRVTALLSPPAACRTQVFDSETPVLSKPWESEDIFCRF